MLKKVRRGCFLSPSDFSSRVYGVNVIEFVPANDTNLRLDSYIQVARRRNERRAGESYLALLLELELRRRLVADALREVLERQVGVEFLVQSNREIVVGNVSVLRVFLSDFGEVHASTVRCQRQTPKPSEKLRTAFTCKPRLIKGL